MNIAVIIPDRGDRPEFTEFCLEKIRRQTIQPVQVLHMNYPPESNRPDITQRYRRGYELVRDDITVIALMENDDWYSDTYLEESAEFWIETGQPDLLGRTFTRYYNIRERAWFDMKHVTRSSAMNTMIRPHMKFAWCPDHEPYTDSYLWNFVNFRKSIIDMPLNSMGIKHGIGMCGGKNHTDYLHRYINHDQTMSYLKSVVGDDFQFYKKLYERLHR